MKFLLFYYFNVILLIVFSSSIEEENHQAVNKDSHDEKDEELKEELDKCRRKRNTCKWLLQACGTALHIENLYGQECTCSYPHKEFDLRYLKWEFLLENKTHQEDVRNLNNRIEELGFSRKTFCLNVASLFMFLPDADYQEGVYAIPIRDIKIWYDIAEEIHIDEVLTKAVDVLLTYKNVTSEICEPVS